MMTENFKKLLLTLFLILFVGWILVNPYICLEGSNFISNLSFLINDFCKNISVNYRFSNDDILKLLRFFEYSVFGIFSAMLYKLYFFKKIWYNIANPLFLGLLVSVLEIYFKGMCVCESGMNIVLVSFCEFCIGLFIVLIFCARKHRSIFSSKRQKNKYVGRS